MAEAAVFRTKRRYLFAKSLKSRIDQTDLHYTWDAERSGLPGTEFPSTYPARASLIAAGYWALEDLQGATIAELRSAGLSSIDAAAVFAEIGEPT